MTCDIPELRFVCVGAQKAGTTTLHNVLKNHPDICLPTLKEAHFFDHPERYANGLSWWLNSFFDNYRGERCVGVVTPEYLYYEEVPARIRQDLGGELKIIIILRDPVARAYSHYNMSVSRGYENLSFNDAIGQETTRIAADEFGRNHFSYVSRGMYSQQVSRYLELFGHDQVLILQFERDIAQNLQATLGRLQTFIDVPVRQLRVGNISNPAAFPRFRWIDRLLRGNSEAKKFIGRLLPTVTGKVKMAQLIERLNRKRVVNSPLPPELCKRIYREFFARDVERLEEMLDRRFDDWKR
jgi:hypothetical protein